MHALIFEDLDFEFEERLKNLDVMERAAGVRHVLKGRELMEQWKFSMAEEHLLRAYATLEAAIEANPSDLFLCMLMGDACSEICEVMRVQSDDKTTELLAEKTDKQEVMRLAERFKVLSRFLFFIFLTTNNLAKGGEFVSRAGRELLPLCRAAGCPQRAGTAQARSLLGPSRRAGRG